VVLRTAKKCDRARSQYVETLAGSAVGVAIGSVGYAFVEAAFGSLGLHFAILWDLGNLIAGLPLCPERGIYVKSHISCWEHSSHCRLIGRGVPSVSVVSQLVYKFLCLASPKENPQVPICPRLDPLTCLPFEISMQYEMSELSI